MVYNLSATNTTQTYLPILIPYTNLLMPCIMHQSHIFLLSGKGKEKKEDEKNEKRRKVEENKKVAKRKKLNMDCKPPPQCLASSLLL